MVRAGATHLQIDEPYFSGFPEDLPWALKAINEMVAGVNAHVTLHICYGNRYGKPSFEGSYQFLFPAILEARVQAVSMEFARRGEDDLKLFKEFNVPFQVAIGVIDVKTNEVESPAFVADRIRRGLEVIAPERLIITPDCGLVRLPRDVAFSKLTAMWPRRLRCAATSSSDSMRGPICAASPRTRRRSGPRKYRLTIDC